MKTDIENVCVIEGNLSWRRHQQALIELTNSYLNDTMGEGYSLTLAEETQLISGLINHRSALIFFAEYKNRIIGLATCFLGFSTFQAKKLINIHDLIVLLEYRHQGVAEKILQYIEEKARALDCCKLTLEVRADNVVAMGLYRKLGFSSGKQLMYFWTKPL